MSPEQKIQQKILKYLTSIGAYHFKVISATRKGIPDITACLNGRFIFIEVKAKKEEPSPLQKHNLKLAQEAGGISQTAWTVEMVKKNLIENGLI